MNTTISLGENEAFPMPLNLASSAISRHAESLRKSSGLLNGFEIRDLVRLNSGRIVDQTELEVGDRAFEYDGSGNFRIYLSTLRSGLSNNMIAAREFGHVVLHGPAFARQNPGMTMVMPKIVSSDNEDLHRCRWEADCFAKSFLMPEAEFLKAVEELGHRDASSLFAVTLEAAKSRHEEIIKNRAVLDTAPIPI